VRTRPLGRTGIQVSPYCLGTMMFGPNGNPDPDDCVRIIHRALDAGINFIDTADVYGGDGETERIVGRALRGRRDDVVLATKFNGAMGPGPNQRGSSRRYVVTAVEASLRRLGAERRGLARFRTEQPPYSIFNRGIERDVLPVCERYGLGTLVWSPLAMGLLTGRYRKGGPEQPSHARMHWVPRHMTDENKLDAVEQLVPVADAAGLSLTHLALAFVISHPAVTSAIIGPGTMAHLDDLLAGAGTTLGDDVLDEVDDVVPPGVDLSPLDVSYVPPALAQSRLRRRAMDDRAAA
jgi:aryl-alcohol dehydrogenase-like predicted oxidoreductase